MNHIGSIFLAAYIQKQIFFLFYNVFEVLCILGTTISFFSQQGKIHIHRS